MNSFTDEMKRLYGENTKVAEVGKWDDGIVYRVTTPAMQTPNRCCGNPVTFLYKNGQAELLYGKRKRDYFKSIATNG